VPQDIRGTYTKEPIMQTSDPAEARRSEGIEQVKVMILPGGWVDRKNAARAMNRAPKTLAEWKRLGLGPCAHNRGGRIFYRWSDVQAAMSGEVA
jgi:hypothetical protein